MLNGYIKGTDTVGVFLNPLIINIEEINDHQFVLFHNPTSDHFLIENYVGSELGIINNLGEIVFRKKVENENELISVSTLPNGIYQVMLSDSFKRLFSTLVVLR